MRKLVALFGGIVAVAAVALVAVPAAQAHKVVYKTSLEVTEVEAKYLRGVVRSGKGKCLRNRKVNIYRDVNGQSKLIATVRTNGSGEWGGGGEPLGHEPQVYVFPKKLALTKKQRKQNRKKKNRHVHRCGQAHLRLDPVPAA
jgi:hypothetical protein